MKVTNNTAYATVGCDVQLSENDRLALGVELDKIVNWLDSVDDPEATTESVKAINNIVAFISKFAIRPSKSNVFTDSPEEFKEAVEAIGSTTAVEPVPAEDNVITVDITSAKQENLLKLTKIIYHVSDASIVRITNLLNSAKENHTPCVSFRCINNRKEKVVDEIVGAGFQIVQNTTNSLRL